MFAFAGILKLFGDLAALVGPVAITKIVEYIDINLNASAPALTQSTPAIVFDGRTNLAENWNKSNYIERTAMALPVQISRVPQMINENTEIYYPTWNEFVSNGWIIALFVLFATLAQGTLSQASTHIVNMIGIRLRSSLQSLVYRKTLLISSSCFRAGVAVTSASVDAVESNGDTTTAQCNGSGDGDNVSNIGRDDANERQREKPTLDQRQQRPSQTKSEEPTTNRSIDTGTITNLMTEDALNVMSFFWIAHYVWAIPLKVSRSASNSICLFNR